VILSVNISIERISDSAKRTVNSEVYLTRCRDDGRVTAETCVGCKKGKFVPRTGHEGPEGEYRYSSTPSLTSALVEGGWSTPRPGRFTPGK
jgi:hypothetical protein